PGTVLVPFLRATPSRPPVNYRRSLRPNPTPDVFRDSGMADEPWFGRGYLGSFCIRGVRHTQCSVTDSRGRKNDVGTVRRRISRVYEADGATSSGVGNDFTKKRCECWN